MTKYLVCILTILMLSSCKKRELQVLVAGQDCKYWLKLSDESKSQTIYYFDKSGKWSVFIRPYRSNTMKKYNGGDVMPVEKWSVIDDSILNIGGIGYAVTRISNKMIIIKNKHFKDTLVYLPSPPSIEENNSD